MDPHIYGKLMFDKGAKAIKTNFFPVNGSKQTNLN